jgi:peptide chain release factor 1
MSQLPIQQIFSDYQKLSQDMAQALDPQEMIKLSKQLKPLEEKYQLAKKLEYLENYLVENQEMLEEINGDEELLEMTKADITKHQQELSQTEEELLSLLAPSDPKDDEDIMLEIRAGAGGDESSIFTGDLLRMYNYLADQLNLGFKVISASPNPVGGFKEVIVEIRGQQAYSWFKTEGGVHRVQRVPATEKQGRIHTSTSSVAIMPLIDENSDFKLDMSEVEVVTSTSQGAGGQSVNTTYSAIKVKHLPTGIEAQSQDERNQIQNKIKALQVLTSRVFDFYEQQRLAEEMKERKDQVGTADRSEKIRTYNYPQDRVTDHRYNLSWNQLPGIMNGGILQVIKDIKRVQAEKVLEDLNS